MKRTFLALLLLISFVSCGNMTPSGDMTAVNTPAGGGLSGGASFGAANLSITPCVNTGDVRAWDGDSWECAPPGATYTAGDGLTLTSAEFAIDPTYTQRRVSATCAVGSSIRAVAEDGTVTCQTVSSFSTANAIPRGNGTGLVASGLTDDGTTISASRRVVISNTGTTGALGVTQASSASTTNNLGAIAVTHSGTVDTTASSMNAFGIIAQVTATRSAGANDLNNIAIYANATGAQNNEAIRADNGNVVLNKTSGNTCIGSSGCTTKLSVRGAGGSSGLTPIGNTIAMLENSGAPTYLSLLNASSDMGVIFSNSTATNDGYILYTTAREMVLRSKGVNSMTLGGNSITINGATSVLGNVTLTRDDGGSHANRPILAITNSASTGSLAHRAELQLNAYDATNVSRSSFIRADGGTINIDAATDVQIQDPTTIAGTLTATGLITANGSLTVNGTASVSSWFLANTVYAGTDGFAGARSTNATATVDINKVGYNNGTSQFRNLQINDGKGNVVGTNSIAYFDGATKETTLYGALDVNNDLVKLGSTIDGGVYITGGPTGANSINFEYGTAAIATGYINRVANAGATGTFRNLVIADGKTAAIATFTGSTKAVQFFGAVDVDSTFNADAAVKTTNIITPATVSGTLNDWAPTGIADAVVIRLRTSGNVTINGIAAGTSPTGRHLWIEYTGTHTVTFSEQSGSNASSTNRLNLKGLTSKTWDGSNIGGPSNGLNGCTMHFVHDGTEWVMVDGDVPDWDSGQMETCQGAVS